MQTANAPAIRVLLVVAAYLSIGLRVFAQTTDSPSREDANKSSISTTDFNRKDVNSTRIIESHRLEGNRTIDTRSVEIPGDAGHLKPFQDVERETWQVDVNTQRTTTRTFARDVNGIKKLVDVTEEEKHVAPSGDSKIVRLLSVSDLNGKLQPVRREIVETKSLGTETEETNSTVMLASINGGLVPAIKTHEFRKRVADDKVETEKTTWLLDINRSWQVNEVRQATTRQEGTNRTTEERVSRPDSAGKLGVVSRVVSQEPESTSGEKRSVVETYSIDVPGTTRDGSLHLVEREVSTERVSPTGEQATEQKVEQINLDDPAAGIRVSRVVDDKIVPGPSGEQSTVTVRARDLNGNFGIVSVDTTKRNQLPSVQIQPTPSEKP